MLSNDLKWFAYLCVRKGMTQPDLCQQVAHALGDNADVLLFAETLIANDICTDTAKLQQLIDQAYQKAKSSLPPPTDVFDPKAASVPIDPAPAPPKTEAIPASITTSPTEDFALKTDFLNERPELHLEVQEGMNLRPTLEMSTHPKHMVIQPSNEEEKDGQTTGHSNAQQPAQTTSSPPPGTSPSSQLKASIPLAPKMPPSAPAPTAPPKQKATIPSPAPAPIQVQAGLDENMEPVTASPKKAKLPPPAGTELNLGFDIAEIQDVNVDLESVLQMNDKELKVTMVKLLFSSQKMGASDLHLSADARPFVRHNLKIRYLTDHILTAEESLKLNCALLSQNQDAYFREKQDFDYALALDHANRFRVNLMIHKDGAAGTYRIVPNQVRTLEELGFQNAETIRKLLDFHNGLILVTGPVGSGKTTTLASLVAELNEKRQDHIICVENPIEIVHHSLNCSVTQREVGSHTNSFHAALKGALREDPDIIVIGELRDLETIEMAITAAETGHLVIGTLHTADASTTLNRLLDVFPPAQQPQIRAMTAESLRGVICQRLLPDINGELTVACELLLNNLAVSNLIRDGKAHALRAVLETGSKQGMCMMDSYILSLWQQGIISAETAHESIVDRAVRNRVKSQEVLGGTADKRFETPPPGEGDAKKKWGLFK